MVKQYIYNIYHECGWVCVECDSTLSTWIATIATIIIGVIVDTT